MKNNMAGDSRLRYFLKNNQIGMALVISALLGLFGYHICKVSGVESCDFASDEAKEEHYNTLHNSAYREDLQK